GLAWPTLRPSETGIVVSYALTLLYVQSTVESMMQLTLALGAATTAARNCEEMGLNIGAKGSEQLEMQPLSSCHTIEMRGVVYEYRGEKDEVFSLGPVARQIRTGRILYVVGGNGSGKSTLIKGLPGLYAPQGGAVVVDGMPVNDATRAGYRQ